MLIGAFVFIIGCCIGSFLNVVIVRLPKGQSVVTGRSICQTCKKTIIWYENIPVISYLFLRGRCSKCKVPISIQYPLIELLMGIMAIFLFRRYGMTSLMLFYYFMVSVLICISAIDFYTMMIPDSLQIALVILCLVTMGQEGFPKGLHRVVGMCAVSIPMYFMNLCIPDSFGFGDVKLMAACGFLLGWKTILIAMFLAVLLGGSYSIYLLVFKRNRSQSHIPFGPYLSVGICFSAFYGQQLLDWYVSTFFKR